MIIFRALGRKGAHLPFRASKLTQVLRDSFIGDKVKHLSKSLPNMYILPLLTPINVHPCFKNVIFQLSRPEPA